MSGGGLEIYHRLPGWARSCAATARGWQLSHRRYGPETEALVAQALERDVWPAERIRHWQQEGLARQLTRAATKVPYYRELWSQRRRRGDRSSWERLENWPLLEKEEVRRYGEGFVAEDCERRRMWVERTSGTTGTPLALWRSRRTLRERYAIYEARHRLWYGVSRQDRWAMAGVQMVAPRIQTEPPYWVWNAAQRQLYVSVYHLGPLQARATLRAISRARCRYLWGYPSALDALARAALEEPASRPSLAVVISNAEPLLAQQRLRIERAFGCAVRDTYGLVELVAGGGECEAGRLHLFPEFGWVETLDERGGPVLGAPGEIVATSLLDRDMPLVRYRTGDRGVGGRSSSTCSCGRGLEELAALEGRQDDVVYSIDGRPVARLDPVFKDNLAVREAQVIQEADGEVCVRLVAADGFGQADERMIARELQDRLGALPVRFELVDRIARGPNGKFRGVISRRRPTQTVAQAAAGH